LKAALANVRVVLSDGSVNMVILMGFLSIFGLGLVSPTLPLFAGSFHVGYGAVGIFISTFGLTRLLADLAAGPLVQRFGERGSSTGGLILMGIGALVTGTAPIFLVAVVAWGTNGAGSAVLFAAQYSYLLKVVPQERMARTLSVFYGAFNVGFVAGSIVGGTLSDNLGIRTPLILYGFVLFAVATAYFRLIRNPPQREAGPTDGESGTGIRSLFKIPGFITVNFINLAYLWMVAAVFGTLVPLFAGDGLGMSRSATGLVIGFALGIEFLCLYPAGAYADRHGRRPVLVPSLLGLGITTIVVGWAPTPLVFGALMGLLGVSSGYAGVPPAAMLSDIVPGERLSTAVGVFRFSGDLGFFFGPLVAGFGSAAFGFRGAFALVALPSLLAFVFILRTAETLRGRVAPAIPDPGAPEPPPGAPPAH
jgi:MFS family permease